ncbi:caspase-3-like [Octopus sinensis]|uniref:Caspase-3-like n=1 Tax=Octopus sinensis TaxID=2607531 RepID=A0A7E6EUQ5_9MOLL|nr:caspase-3-like [Octopus sinensis]
MDYVDAQHVEGIFFKEKDPDSQPEDVEMVSHEENSESINARYDMDRNKENLALIINNVHFDKLSYRQGSDEDASEIKKSLKSLHFEVIDHNNLSVKEMTHIFTDISTKDHTKYNCFVCVILTHGEDDNQIYGTDDKVKLDTLVEMLLPERCPSLIGKPKLFFIQACRGQNLTAV